MGSNAPRKTFIFLDFWVLGIFLIFYGIIYHYVLKVLFFIDTVQVHMYLDLIGHLSTLHEPFLNQP